MNNYPYISNHINEGFDVFGRAITLNPRHNLIVDTSLSGKPTKTTIFSNALDTDIDVYSIFKRMELTPEQRKITGLSKRLGGDSNPVIYSLKKEGGWHFKTASDENEFWRIFKYNLRCFLRDHKNEFNTAVLVPSTNRLNNRILNSIKEIAEEVGITSFVTKGLFKLYLGEVESICAEETSYFYKYWTEKGMFKEAYEELQGYLDEMETDYINNGVPENDQVFKYHYVKDMALRKTIIETISIDEQFKKFYANDLNGTNVLIVDDSITHGISIESTINAISTSYSPATVSVLTMFSKLYDSDGNEIKSKDDIPLWLKEKINEAFK